MVVSQCGGKWRFFNFELVTESLEDIPEATRTEIGHSLFRILEHPHDPRGLIWFEQRVGYFRGARVAQVAQNWFLTYEYYDYSPVGECVIYVIALGNAPPK
jgi:hypothetical protein